MTNDLFIHGNGKDVKYFMRDIKKPQMSVVAVRCGFGYQITKRCRTLGVKMEVFIDVVDYTTIVLTNQAIKKTFVLLFVVLYV